MDAQRTPTRPAPRARAGERSVGAPSSRRATGVSDITRPTSLSLPPQKWYRSGRAPLVLAAAVCGVIAFVVSWLGSWVPSFWGDEAASIMSAERPWSSLMNELARVDAVHGTYYAFLHLWIDVFGASQLSTRVPSAIGVGLAAAGIVVLVARMERLWPANGRDGLSSAVGAAGIRLGVIAAMVFAVLPRTTYMGTEVRSYALGTACAVWLAVLFLTLVGGRVTRVLPWVGFAAAYGACIYVFLYLSLIALPFGAMLLWDARGRLRTTALAIVRPGSAPSAEVAARARSARRWLLASVGGRSARRAAGVLRAQGARPDQVPRRASRRDVHQLHREPVVRRQLGAGRRGLGGARGLRPRGRRRVAQAST
ncbi:glycosyltransferase family 39 protein [Humibacter ginsenosidimutans]|uniref:Glycosyltransferase RgtA/B/C/D-like domain-containing protein n=1 Tax=Humibacter ginsenosidimutans TaxID=2599293 RepID=A0A5B8M8B3_9MICO|nr:hypothetical protein [Humibacter ginsenosidimutans]QDZ15660.1 hypothetical protein FPZ11_13640 [Humibacter ginsenosidimutans]